MNFPEELLNNVLLFRPTHPSAELLKRDIMIWGCKRTYFYKHYFQKIEIIKQREKRERNLEYKDFFFKCLLEDGYTVKQIIQQRYEMNQCKKRLDIKLKELNLKNWQIKTCGSNNHLQAEYNGVEIFNETF